MNQSKEQDCVLCVHYMSCHVQGTKDCVNYESHWDDDLHDYNEELNTLHFSCSLKNYNNTIGKFIDFLPQIADKWNLESLYEECEPSESTHYSNKE